MVLLLLVISECTNSNDQLATISVNFNSEYVKTFDDLQLGLLYDFDFKLPNADKRWVRI